MGWALGSMGCGLGRTSETMSAPWIGGLEYMGLMMILSWEATRSASAASAHTTDSVPVRSPYSPKFFANDCARASGRYTRCVAARRDEL